MNDRQYKELFDAILDLRGATEFGFREIYRHFDEQERRWDHRIGQLEERWSRRFSAVESRVEEGFSDLRTSFLGRFPTS